MSKEATILATHPCGCVGAALNLSLSDLRDEGKFLTSAFKRGLYVARYAAGENWKWTCPNPDCPYRHAWEARRPMLPGMEVAK